MISEEEFVAKARIYHRYRISAPGGRKSTIRAEEGHPQLPFFSVKDEETLINELTQTQADDLDALRRDRLRTVVLQESATQESSFELDDQNQYPGFRRYLARHENDTKLTVRLFHADINNPKVVHKFFGFQVIDDPDIFLLSAQGSLVEAFLKRLLSSPDSRLEVSYPHLDLKRLSEAGTTQIRGASFRIAGRPNLTTAMVFGPDVNEDDAWDEYSQIGQLTYVHLQVIIEDMEIKMMVTGRGSILPYGLGDIYQELKLCRDVYDKFLKQYELGEEPLRKQRRR